MTGARVWLFRLPSGQVVAAFTLDADCQLGQIIDLLDDCYFADVQVGDDRAEAYLSALAARLGMADDQSEQLFFPERHVFRGLEQLRRTTHLPWVDAGLWADRQVHP